MIYRKPISLLLFLSILLLSVASCGNSDASSDVTSSDTSTESGEPAETEPAYVYPTANYDGHSFTILNQDDANWANVMIDPIETTGDLINDAMYERNLRIEERYGITITEEAVGRDNIATMTKNSVNAGDDAYDLVMCPIDALSSLLLDGYFAELTGISSLNLDKPWWDQAVIRATTLNDQCYFASSDITFFPFEATWVVYFNEDRFTELSLDYPYQLVRDGEWTIDKLTELTKLGASLNGQETYAYTAAGTAEYGMITHDQFVEALIFGAGEGLISTENNQPIFTGATDRMYTVYDKIAALTKNTGAFLDRNDANLTDTDRSPSLAFKNGRFMTFAETLGHISNLRDFAGNFGVLPVPKLNAEQDGYHSMLATWGTLMTTIPASASNLERTGVILDALAYDSYTNLMGPYYDTYLNQKGARNEDSIEMLGIIRDTRTVNVGKMYGWTSSLISSLTSKLIDGNADVASTIASATTAIDQAIAKTQTFYTK